MSKEGRYVKRFTDFLFTEYLPHLTHNLRKGVKSRQEIKKKTGERLQRELKQNKEKSDLELLHKYGTKLCSYIYWSEKSDVPLNIEKQKRIEPRLSSLCQLMEDTKVYIKFRSHPLMMIIPQHDFLFNIVSQNVVDAYKAEHPRYLYFSAHQEQLMPVLQILGHQFFKRSEPAGSMLLEVYGNSQETTKLKVQYTEENKIVSTIEYSLKEFLSLLHDSYREFTKVFGSEKVPVQQVCQTDFNVFMKKAMAAGVNFNQLENPRLFLERLAAKYDLLEVIHDFDEYEQKRLQKSNSPPKQKQAKPHKPHKKKHQSIK